MKIASFLAVIVALGASHAFADTPADKAAAAAGQLRTAITGAGLTAAAQAPLIAQLGQILSAAKCTNTATPDCSKASPDQLAALQDALPPLRSDFAAAVKQAAATKALAQAFAADAVQVRATISGGGLTTAAQAPLIAQFLKILSAAKCTSTAGGVDCSQASQDQLTAAQAALQQLRYDYTAALKQPAALPPKPAANAPNASAAPFVAAAGQVRSAIADPRLSAAAQAPLIARFQAMLNNANCTSTANGLDCSRAAPLQLALAQAALQSIRDGLTAALAQAAAAKALAQTVAADAGTLKSAIVASGLTAAAQEPLIDQFTKILNAANCANAAKGVDCSQSSLAQLQTAQAALPPLRAGLTAALKQAAAALALAQGTFAAKAGAVLNALNDPKMIVTRPTFLPQLNKVLSAAKCTSTGKSADCSQATQAQLAAAQGGLDTVSVEVGQVAALNQAAGGVALSQQTFAARAGQMLAQINTVTMTAAVRSQLVAQFAVALNEASCTNTAKGVDCSRAEQSQLADAQVLFDRLSTQIQLAPSRP